MDNPTTRPSLREVMAGYPTGVTVVAACDESGRPFGLTVNSFASVSLDPPLVLVCIGHASSTHGRLVAADSFAVNILSADQGPVARRFAGEPSGGRFDNVAWASSESGDPILKGVAAWLDCSIDRVVDGGDHSILLGRVQGAGAHDRPALVFYRGRMSSIDG